MLREPSFKPQENDGEVGASDDDSDGESDTEMEGHPDDDSEPETDTAPPVAAKGVMDRLKGKGPATRAKGKGKAVSGVSALATTALSEEEGEVCGPKMKC